MNFLTSYRSEKTTPPPVVPLQELASCVLIFLFSIQIIPHRLIHPYWRGSARLSRASLRFWSRHRDSLIFIFSLCGRLVVKTFATSQARRFIYSVYPQHCVPFGLYSSRLDSCHRIRQWVDLSFARCFLFSTAQFHSGVFSAALSAFSNTACQITVRQIEWTDLAP